MWSKVKACKVWHLCPEIRAISITSFMLSSLRGSVRTGDHFCKQVSISCTAQVAVYFGRAGRSWKTPLRNLQTRGCFPMVNLSSGRITTLDSAERAVLIALYPRPSSNSDEKKSSTTSTDDEIGSCVPSAQNPDPFSRYTKYCFRVPSRHPERMISWALSETPFACRFVQTRGKPWAWVCLLGGGASPCRMEVSRSSCLVEAVLEGPLEDAAASGTKSALASVVLQVSGLLCPSPPSAGFCPACWKEGMHS